MLNLHESMETTDTVAPKAPQISVRPDTSFLQLDIDFLDTPARISDGVVHLDEPRIIRRLSENNWIDKIRQVIEVNSCVNPDWNWEKILLGLTGNLSFEVARILEESLDEDVKKVAVHVAPDQPLQHKKLMYRPTYCPVFTFGPNARGPPLFELNSLSCISLVPYSIKSCD